MNTGLWGAVVGSTLGIAGGIIGTYASIRNTNSPRERAFMIRASIGIWIGLIIFLALVLLLSSPYKWLIWAPYAIILSVAINAINKQQARIRQEEG